MLPRSLTLRLSGLCEFDIVARISQQIRRSRLSSCPIYAFLLDMTKHLIPTGESLRSLRNLAGLTLSEVSDIAGTSIAYLSKVERGDFVPTKRYVAQVTSAIAGVLADAEKVPA